MNALKDLIDAGVKFFPIVKNSKIPQIRDFSNRAVSNLAEVQGWLDHGDNIAIATGRVADHKFLVGVDIDNKRSPRGNWRNGFEAIEWLGMVGKEFPSTWSQRTPTGGVHYLFWSPVPVRSGTDILGIGIDVKCDGGYLVGPGSSLNGQFYQALTDGVTPNVLPDWCIAQLVKSDNTPMLVQSELHSSIDFGMARRRAVEYLSRAEVTRYGQRNDVGYRHACKLKDYGLPANHVLQLLIDEWRCEDSLEISEIMRIVNSAFSYGKSPTGIDAPENVFEKVAPEPATHSQGLRMTFDGVFRMESSHEPLVEGLLNQGELSAFIGPPNVGKTAMLTYAAICVAAGVPMFGKPTVQGGVLYCGLENPTSVHLRMLATKQKMGLTENLPMAIVEDPVNFGTPNRDGDLILESCEKFEQAMGQKVKLIVFDTLSRLMSGADENSAQAMSQVVRELDRIKHATGAHIAVVHHTGKDAGKGARGSNCLLGAVDTEIMIRKDSIVATKQRDMEVSGKPIGFRLEVRDLGRRRNGTMATSVAVVPMTADEQAAAIELSEIGPTTNTGLAYNILKRLIADEGELAHPSLGLPEGIKVHGRKEWEESMGEELYSAGTSHATKHKAFTRALKSLTAAGKVKCVDGVVWVVGPRLVLPQAGEGA